MNSARLSNVAIALIVLRSVYVNLVDSAQPFH